MSDDSDISEQEEEEEEPVQGGGDEEKDEEEPQMEPEVTADAPMDADDSSDDDLPAARKKRKRPRTELVDDAADESDDGNKKGGAKRRVVDSSEEDEDGLDTFEKDNFLVDGEDEGEDVGEGRTADADEDSDAEDEDHELDEDDLQLINENTGQDLNIVRNKGEDGKKFKRLKRRMTGADHEEEEEGIKAKGEVDLAHSLFGDGDDDSDDGQPSRDRPAPATDDEDSGAEDDGFIVNDVGAAGDVYREPDPHREVGAHPLSAEQRDIANQIFGEHSGNVFTNQPISDSEEDDGDVYIDDEGNERKVEVDSLLLAKQHFEPSIIAERFLTDQDEAIRVEDIPERLQLWHEAANPKRNSEDARDRFLEEMEEEAAWIVDTAFRDPLVSGFSPEVVNENEQEITQVVKNVLKLLLVDKVEVPFIELYRKGLISPLRNNQPLELRTWH